MITSALAIILLIIGDTRHLSLRVISVAVVASGIAQGVVLAHHAHPLRHHLHTVFALLVSSVRVAYISVVTFRLLFPALSLLELLVGICIPGKVP